MSSRRKHKRNKESSNPQLAHVSNEFDNSGTTAKPTGEGTSPDLPESDAPRESNNKKPLDNIKFGAYVLSMMVTLFVAITNFVPYFESRRGKFVAKVNGDEVVSPFTRTSLVYLDEDSIDFVDFDFFPIISNPTKYPLKDVLVKYTISPYIPGVSITDYYDAHKIRQNLEVTNKDNTLHQSIPLSSPFSSFIMRDNERVTVTLQATHKGIKEPFFYETNIYSKRLVVENGVNRIESIFDDVKLFFESNSIDTCDLYILDSGRMSVHENFVGTKAFHEISSDSETSEISVEEKERKPWYMAFLEVILIIVNIVLMLIAIDYSFWPYPRLRHRGQLTFQSIGLFLITKPTRTIILKIAKMAILPFFSGVAMACAYNIESDWIDSIWRNVIICYYFCFSFYFSFLFTGELFKKKKERTVFMELFPFIISIILIFGFFHIRWYIL